MFWSGSLNALRSFRGAYVLIAASLILTVISMILRLIIGALSSNEAVLIEGIHASLDVAITLAVLIALTLVRSRLAKGFPYGLYKVEDLVTLILAGVLFAIAVELGYEGFSKPPSTPSLLPMIAQATSLAPLAGASYLKYVASKKLNSPSLRADSIHTVGDVAEGGGVALGLLAYAMSSNPIAYRASILVAVAGIVAAAYEAGHESFLSILDLPLDKGLIDRILKSVESSFRDVKVDSVKARWAGPVIFVEMLISTHPLKTIEEAFMLLKEINNYVKRLNPNIIDVTITVEPTIRKDFKICLPQDLPTEYSPISKHFGRARYFAIVTVKNMKVTDVKVIPNTAKDVHAGDVPKQLLVGARIAELLHKNGVTDVIVTNIGEIAYSLLVRHKIVVWRAREGLKVNELINLFLNFKLERLYEPTREESWARREGHAGS